MQLVVTSLVDFTLKPVLPALLYNEHFLSTDRYVSCWNTPTKAVSEPQLDDYMSIKFPHTHFRVIFYLKFE